MFGYIIVNKPEMKFREFDVYHGYYCGLCRKLKEHYGKFGQITLSYDMVFVLMTLTSLYSIFPYKNFWKTHFYGIKFFLIPTSLICGHHSNHLYICNKLTKYSCARHNP